MDKGELVDKPNERPDREKVWEGKQNIQTRDILACPGSIPVVGEAVAIVITLPWPLVL